MTVEELASFYPKILCDANTPSGDPKVEIIHTKMCKDVYGPRSKAVAKTGNDKPHNNLAPSVAVYAWRRQA